MRPIKAKFVKLILTPPSQKVKTISNLIGNQIPI